MPVRQDMRNGVDSARNTLLGLLQACLNMFKRIWVLILRLVSGMGSFTKSVYAFRAQIVGALLLATFTSLLLFGLNHFIGFRNYTNNLNKWLLVSHHLELVIVVLSFLILLTWNYVSSTLRTLLSDSWFRVGIWFVVSVVLLLCASFGWPEKAIAYRIGYVGGLVIYVIVLGLLAELFPPRKLVHADSPYIVDNPKEQTDTVLYESQKQVVADIQYLISEGIPSTIAITGRWGIGKTFLFKQAKDRLDEKDVIWVDFEPWRYASEEALIRGFYQDIGKALAKGIPGIQHITRPLIDTTDKFVRKHDSSGIVGTILDMFRDVFDTSQSPETQIKDLLIRESKRLIIVIDDVERSFNAERIFRTLQLSLFAKNIDNVQVVFLCDKEVVLTARPTHFSDSSQNAAEYLEKFVEREVLVPSPRTPELRQLFASLMALWQSHQGFEFDDSDITNDMLSAMATPRATIRLVNEFAAFRVNRARSEE